jgi:hypothetical protein
LAQALQYLKASPFKIKIRGKKMFDLKDLKFDNLKLKFDISSFVIMASLLTVMIIGFL